MIVNGPYGEQIAQGSVTLERGEWFEILQDTGEAVMTVEVDIGFVVVDRDPEEQDYQAIHDEVILKAGPAFPQLSTAWSFMTGNIFPGRLGISGLRAIHLKYCFQEPRYVWVQYEVYRRESNGPISLVTEETGETRIVSDQKGRTRKYGIIA